MTTIAEQLYWTAWSNKRRRLNQNHERVVARNPFWAYRYAHDIIHGRFELAERAIANRSDTAYYYAADVTRCRFELGEPMIARDTLYSYLYARDIICGRFELGEPAISRSARHSFLYAKNVLHGRFIAGEPAIKSMTHLACVYADLISKSSPTILSYYQEKLEASLTKKRKHGTTFASNVGNKDQYQTEQ